MLPLAVVTAVFMLIGWFPLKTLWNQQSQLNEASAQLRAIHHQELALKTQAKSIDTKAAAMALAREQYQLVSPNQSLIQVLPGNASGQVSATSADPGLQPLVSPTEAALPTIKTGSTHHLQSGFVHRLVHTLEFWH
jgi:hypothetical protein